MISVESSSQYEWGNKCLGWHLVNSPELSVIQESMPKGTSEQKHCHSKSQQFFYILSGVATFDVEGKMEIIKEGEGIHILPGQIHCISNKTESDLRFLVVSQPHSHGDRVNF